MIKPRVLTRNRLSPVIGIWAAMLFCTGTAQAELIRQGGDTLETAIEIVALPFMDSGTTVGYGDDYDAVCPQGSGAPDVCYRFTPANDMVISIDMCGSEYDTKVFVYEEETYNLVGCNDDYYSQGEPCGVYVSRIEEVELVAARGYYVVVDGYGSEDGNYQLEVRELVACDLTIPNEVLEEGEPTLHDGYVDMYNGGCNSQEYGYPVSAIAGDANGDVIIHGRTGWYNTWTKDYDWYAVQAGATGVVEVVLAAEQLTILGVSEPYECSWYDWDVRETVERCETRTVEVGADGGAYMWIVVVPRQNTLPFDQNGAEYDYLLTLSGIQGSVEVESKTWGAVKSLFR
jgi:hypothetical protein